VLWDGWGVGGVGVVVGCGGWWYVFAALIGRYVYIKLWSDSLYVLDDSVYIFTVCVLHSM
jgi:hypothetical protein